MLLFWVILDRSKWDFASFLYCVIPNTSLETEIISCVIRVTTFEKIAFLFFIFYHSLWNSFSLCDELYAVWLALVLEFDNSMQNLRIQIHFLSFPYNSASKGFLSPKKLIIPSGINNGNKPMWKKLKIYSVMLLSLWGQNDLKPACTPKATSSFWLIIRHSYGCLVWWCLCPWINRWHFG
jgi:hypothetical protein